MHVSAKDLGYDLVTHFYTDVMHINPLETGRITDKLYAVKTGTANFFIYMSGTDIICVDTGYIKSHIKSEMNHLGLDLNDISHVFLTHSDFDHADGLSLFDNAKIYLSSDEEQMITGKRPRMLGVLYNNKVKGPYILMNDGDIVYAGSIKVMAISTPGHTPGSMSFLIDDSILFVGDTFKLVNGGVCPLRNYINMDTQKQGESIGKLACLHHVDIALTGHSGFTKKFDEAISNFRCPQDR